MRAACGTGDVVYNIAAPATNLTAEHTSPECTHAYPVAARQCQYKNRRQCAQARTTASHHNVKILAKEISKDSLTPFALSNHTPKDGNTNRPIQQVQSKQCAHAITFASLLLVPAFGTQNITCAQSSIQKIPHAVNAQQRGAQSSG